MSRSIDFVTLLVGKLAYLHSVDTSRQLYRVPGLHCNHHNKGGEERNRVKSQVEGGTFHKLGTTPPQLLLQSDANFTLDRGIFEDIERREYGNMVMLLWSLATCVLSVGPRSGGSRQLSLSAALQHARVESAM